MERKFDVYGIGNAIVDLQLRIAEEDLTNLGLEKAAMKLVETADQAKLLQYFSGRELNHASGGSAANTMIGIAQLGGTVGYGCLVGDDTFGRFYLDEMRRLGVSLRTSPVSGKETGSSVILITPDAERTMNTHLGVSADFNEKNVSEIDLAESSWLYIEGYLFSSPGGQKAVQRLLQRLFGTQADLDDVAGRNGREVERGQCLLGLRHLLGPQSDGPSVQGCLHQQLLRGGGYCSGYRSRESGGFHEFLL